MQIIIDTNTELSLNDIAMLKTIIAQDSKRVVEEPAEKATPARRAPAKKAEPKPEPVEESPDEDEDLLGDDEPAATQEMIVEKVSELVSKGKGKLVKAILLDAGADKVRSLDADKYDEVYTALQAL